MKKILKKLKRLIKKAINEAKSFKPANYSRAAYFRYRDCCPLNEKVVLLEASWDGRPSGNIAAMVEELAKNPVYGEYTIYLAGGIGTGKGRKSWLTKQGLKNRVKLLTINSVKYYKVLATAKYLVSEDSFIYIFTKRQGQVYLNTWHGTPLMTMGKSKATDFAMPGNEQKNFFDADYLLCQNEDMARIMVEDYDLKNHFHFSLSCIGEVNGNPLQCSCLENPRDGGAWWAAIYGVAQSRTRLK